MKKTYSDRRREGKLAFTTAERSYMLNPYINTSAKHASDWQDGWNEADVELDAELAKDWS